MTVRVDQQAVEVLHKSTALPELRTSKITLRVLTDPVPDAEAKCPCSAYYKLNTDNLRHQTHRLARCWEITRVDGTTYRFTDHNRKVTVSQEESGGVVFSPIQGVSATAQSRLAGLKSGSYEIFGVAGTIPFGDMVGGLMRDASITELVVDWKHPFAGVFRCQTHFIKRISFDGEKWEAELVNQRGKLEKPIGDIYTRGCRFKLFDGATCGLSDQFFTHTPLTVTAVDATEPYRKFTTVDVTDVPASGLLVNNSSYFRFGNVEWLTGANTGLKMEIRNWTDGTNNDWELYLEMPFPVAVNDTFTAFAGCDHTAVQCDQKFGNYTNYGGIPFMPGSDALIRGPGVDLTSIIIGILKNVIPLP